MSTPQDPVHQDRARAESFGGVAGQYDRFRPSYPAALIDDLQSTGAQRVLDIGCGTGKAARALVARGMSVLGVEVDPEMAAVARAHGLDVEVAAFEGWEAQRRSFDLITCAQAWHWIEPAAGSVKVASLLNPGGTFACFWNYDAPHQLHEALAEVYQRHAPDCEAATPVATSLDEPYADALRTTGLFEQVLVRRYHWSQSITADEWVGRVATRSDHIRLAPEQRETLLSEVRDVVARAEPVVLPFGTYAVFCSIRS